jgi:hypothetical protein
MGLRNLGKFWASLLIHYSYATYTNLDPHGPLVCSLLFGLQDPIGPIVVKLVSLYYNFMSTHITVIQLPD